MSTTPKVTKSAAGAPAADAVKHIEDVVAVQKDAIETVVKAGTDVATQSVEHAVALSKEQVDAAVKAGSAAFKGYEDIIQFSKDNVDAFVKSSSIVARGVQDLSRTVATFAQESIDESVTASKALFGAKTLKEVMDLSSSLAKTNLDKLVEEGGKISQLSAKLAEEAYAPISIRVEAAVEKLSGLAA
jgi:phasin family protein